jgi:transcriptional regulator with XRE-family HTH domain
MTNMSIGDRIYNLRVLRDLTQEGLADRAGVSTDTIRKLEQGVRQTARIDTLRALARALDVELDRLVGQPTVTQQLTDDGGLLALRDAIQDVHALPGVCLDDDVEDPPPAETWMGTVKDATALYWAGGYSQLASMLPLILRDGRAVARETTSSRAEQVWAQLALAYQLAASLATQAGHTDWAYQAAKLQLEAAERASDPLMSGMGVSTLSWILLRQGRWEQAQAVAERKADSLEPSFRGSRPAEYAVYGNLLIAAAVPAARQDRTDTAEELLNLAEAAAARSGPIRTYGTAFSPVDVATQQVNIALAGSAADPAKAIRLANRVDHASISRPVHLASHRLDVAQAQYRVHDTEGALATLLEVENEQPEWIRYQTLARVTVQEMWAEERRKSSPLRGLAARLGVDPNL